MGALCAAGEILTKKSPIAVGQLLMNAVALQNSGRIDEADAVYDKILKVDRRNGDALNLKGLIAHQRGRNDEALALFDRAAKAYPAFPDVPFNKGTVLAALGRSEEAIAAYSHAIKLRADHAGARLNLGQLLHASGRTREAVAAYREMTRLCPNEARGFFNLGVCLEKAIPKETSPTAREALAQEGLAALSRALTLDPNSAETHSALSTIYFHLGDYAQAIAHTRKAIALKPARASAWQDLGGHLEATGDRAGALAAYEQALKLDPTHVSAAINRGMTYLALGRFSEGWSGYLRRFESSDFPFTERRWPWPAWNGEDLSDKRILIWCDHGVGDQILFAAMIPEIAARARECVIECEERLVPLYRRSFPELEIVPKTQAAVTALLSRTFDYQRSLLDLGRWLRPSLSAFPNRRAILRADPTQTADFRARYRREGSKLVGISWHSINPTVGHQKSLRLADFTAVLTTPKLTFVNIQYGEVTAEIGEVSGRLGVSVLQDPEVDSLKDLDSFAAQISALDAVVTVSNTAAHMAAALGVPTCIYVPDGRKRLWYWLDQGAFSPWYRTARLWRSAGPETIAAIARVLASL